MNDLLLWQLSDSAFPAGGFAHSNGFEAAFQYGIAQTADQVECVVRLMIRQAGRGVLPFAMAAHRDPSDLPALDRRIDLFLNQPVSNRASRAQGRALLNTVARVFSTPAVAQLAESVSANELAGHLAPIHGAVCRALEVDNETAARLLLFQTARNAISAAVRLGAIGMFDGQALQRRASGEIEDTLEACRDITIDDAAHVAPILDLYQSTQDRLYSRLFQS
jgi:urease accessory protein